MIGMNSTILPPTIKAETVESFIALLDILANAEKTRSTLTAIAAVRDAAIREQQKLADLQMREKRFVKQMAEFEAQVAKDRDALDQARSELRDGHASLREDRAKHDAAVAAHAERVRVHEASEAAHAAALEELARFKQVMVA
jgi:hypothetical protein